jgi:dihydroxy-acid dehydratase
VGVSDKSMAAGREPDVPPGAERSSKWFAGDDINGFNHRAWMKPCGFSDEALRGRPVIGICNTWSELVGCNVHLRALANHVKRGVLQAGGLPLEFPVLSLSETLMKPNAMLYRNLAAMDVEEMIRSHPLDAVVLLSSCDKTTPAVLLGAASANVPAILVTGGPMMTGYFRGKEVGSGTDFWSYSYEVRHGRMSAEEYRDFEASLCRSHGHCMEMATAMSMAVVGEALGIALTDNASIPAVDARRHVLCERAGGRAVQIAKEGLRPRDVMTKESFENAIRVVQAIGGSTNTVVHMLALAGRLGVDVTLDDFAAAADVPVLANLRPSGEHLLEAFFHAGGVAALMHELGDVLHRDLPTVTGRTVADNLLGRESHDHDVIRPLDDPIRPQGALAIVRGSLAPDGAVIKRSAAAPELMKHRGRAYVFESVEDLADRLDDPDLDVTPDSVIVLKGAGPLGGPGMPEWGHIPIPGKLSKAGVDDMVRISDGRISGGSHGAMVVHVAPEAAALGPIGAVQTGDMITLDVDAGRLELEVEPGEVDRRLAERPPASRHYRRGYGALFMDHVLQANEGCDFDVLRRLGDEDQSDLPLGLLKGWVLGD